MKRIKVNRNYKKYKQKNSKNGNKKGNRGGKKEGKRKKTFPFHPRNKHNFVAYHCI